MNNNTFLKAIFYSVISFSEVAVISGATNKALELSKFSEEATYAYVSECIYHACVYGEVCVNCIYVHLQRS